MQLNGTHLLPASPEKIWAMLMDTDTLAKIVPGITRLEDTENNTFKSILEIKIGPVSGAFTGNLQLEDINEPVSFTLKVQQNSKMGNANATIKINMIGVKENQTEVSFDGDAKISGLLARMGQRVLGGVANTLTKQFFSNLEKEIG
jgi:uncharacterized protein